MVGGPELAALRRAGAGAVLRRPPLPGVDGLPLLPPLRVALFTVGLNIFGFFAVASLSGYLAESVRRADEQLAATSNQLADLQAFSQHVIDSLTSGLATTDIDGRVLTFNRAAEAITGIRRRGGRAARSCDVLQLPARRSRRCSARARAGRSCRASSRASRAPTAQIELGTQHGAPAHAARRDRVLSHVPGRDRDRASTSARRASSSGSRRSARWRPGSRTRSATRWPRCRDRSRSCGRSCR